MTTINKIVMHGFKSFAKHTELLFGRDFNCVLGPNGSGKSNVLDALCFVLGKTSSKSLRAEKSANLIYNGGKSKKPAKQGEVSVYFDNSKKIFPTGDETVKISRIIRQNGQSIYKINDKVRTRQQVVDLLSVAKINPDGYNIIMQGDITRFVEMPTEERRKLIEEISGISVYEEKKHKAVLELDKVENKLKETEIVLAERSTHLKELKKDRDQALKFKEMNDKIKQNKASYLKTQIDKKEEEKKRVKEQLDKSNEELEKIQKKITDLKQQNEEKKDEIETITKEIEEKGEKDQVSLNREIESLKIELTKKNSRIEVCKGEIIKINKRKHELDNSIKEIEKKIKELHKEKEDLAKKKSVKEKEKYEFSNKIANFKQKHKLESAAEIEKNIEQIDQKSDELQKEIQALKENQHRLVRDKDKLMHEINTIDARISKVLDVEKEYREQVNELKNKRNDFKKTTLELNKALDQDSTLAAQLGNTRRKLFEANEELAKLTAKNIGIKEAAYGDIAVKQILSLKGKKKGIYGTVAELGNVSTKYSLALEVAAGPRLKSIVVEDDKVAADCIHFLKEKKLGIATFLPLNKLNPKKTSDIEKLADAKGCHGLAIGLVSFDNKFKKVFSYIFADTLVVDNIDVARRIGIGRAKMVTLDGDVTEMSGIMRGGYRLKKRQSLGFKEKEVENDINEYQNKVSDLEKNLSFLEKRKSENEELIAKLRGTKANLEGDIIKGEKILHIESGDLDVSKQRKNELLQEEKGISGEINKIEHKLVELSRELASIKTEKQKLRSQVSQLRNPSLIAELTTFEEKTREISEEVIQITSDIKNIDLHVTMHNSEKEKTGHIIKQIEKDENEFKAEINKFDKDIAEDAKVLREKEAKSKEFYAKFKALFGKRGKINEEIQRNDNLINSQIDESRKVEIRGNTLSLKNAELAAELAGMQQEFQQYEGVRIDTTKTEEQLKSEINKFEKMKEQIGFVNMRALEIYEDVEKQYNSLLEKKDKLAKEKEDVMVMMQEIESKKKDIFMKTFNVVNENFKKFFSILSSKGEAYLDLENPENPFEAGLTIKVKITGQKFLDIRGLSGGEKTMTALAFIFSIQEHEPASFYVLDEVDAALDKHNSEKFAKLIRKYAERAQYIIISHNDGVISEADNLYGVSMNEQGVSQVVSLKI